MEKKKVKKRNMVAYNLLTSGLYKSRKEANKKAYTRTVKHKGNAND